MSSETADADFLRSGDEDDATGGVTLDPSLDSVIGALTDHRRRGVLYVLSDRDEPTFVVDLAQKVALMDPGEDDIETILTELHHVHLPKLSRADLVTFDESANTVRYTGDERVDELLDRAREREQRD
ncbi:MULTISPECIES: DUF7344 domain-containing protein [Salinibaculum]|uniref:DUF7344 domain-containing protein n=1 Tax=Salinibaculum TaxID=2732368 RepID=UPI0030CF8699